MRGIQWRVHCFLYCVLGLLLTSCATNTVKPVAEKPDPRNMPLYMHDPVATDLPLYQGQAPYSYSFNESQFAERLPHSIDYTNGKLLVFDPKKYTWGAYEDGVLVRAGIASGGADYCQDTKAHCRTKTGHFRIYSMGDETCYSREFPLHKGGALMPYCMFFNKGQSFHGSPDQMMTEANISHGCVHLRIPDAAWLRYNFVNIGTKVIILPYDNSDEEKPAQQSDETSSSDI